MRTTVQRRSAQGDCRFEPQGYPAQILGSSTVILDIARAPARDFSDLVAALAGGFEVLIPQSAADRPTQVIGLIAELVSDLTPQTAPIAVRFVAHGSPPAPRSPFIAVSEVPPVDALPRVRFDRGRVAVADPSGQTLLDVGGFTSGAVAQIPSAGEHAGIWIKPLAADGSLPVPPALHLNRGDVAFLDHTGVALEMSTERDTLVRIAYADQTSWLSVANRFRPWIVGGLWTLATVVFLLVLQRMFRRRPRAADE